jgi:hypothetical protein
MRVESLGTTVNDWRFRRAGVIYAILWAPIRLVYLAANRYLRTETSGKDLSPAFWVLALVYFAVDVLLLLGLKFISRVFASGGNPPEKSFWCEVLEIVPIWFLLHLMFLFLEYPVHVRLESVGLGKLTLLVVAAAMITVIAGVFKSRLSEKQYLHFSGNRREWVMYCSVILAACLVLVTLVVLPFLIPYFATRPLSPDQLIR